MSHRTAAWLAWSMWALSMALTVLGLYLLFLSLSYPDVPSYSWLDEGVVEGLGFTTVGAVIVSRGSYKSPIGWLFCATGL